MSAKNYIIILAVYHRQHCFSILLVTVRVVYRRDVHKEDQ